MDPTAQRIGALTGLLIVIAFIGFAWLFREELRPMFKRIAKLRAKVPRVEFEAELDREQETAISVTAASEAAPGPESDTDMAVEELAAIEDVDEDADESLASKRERMFALLDDGKVREATVLLAEVQRDLEKPLAGKEEAVGFYLRLFMSDAGGNPLGELQKLAEDASVEPLARRAIGVCLEIATDFVGAAKEFERAAELAADDVVLQARVRGMAIEAYGKAQDMKSALAVASTGLAAAGENKEAIELVWRGVAAGHHETGDELNRAITLEKVAEFKPNNARLHFDIGYAYANTEESSFSGLALFHYRRALAFDPEMQWAQNNAGVEASRLGLAGTSVAYYAKAEAKSNSLAAANMAQVLITAGFIDQADELISRASEFESVDPAVHAAASRAAKVRKDEAEEVKSIEQSSRRLAAFLGEFGPARFRSTPPKTKQSWRYKLVEVSSESGGGTMEFTWAEGKTKKRIAGKLEGCAFRGDYYEMGKSFLDPEKDTSWAKKHSIYGVLSPEQVRFMEPKPFGGKEYEFAMTEQRDKDADSTAESRK